MSDLTTKEQLNEIPAELTAKKAAAFVVKVLPDFSDLVASDRFDPLQIYDVSVLPHAKERIVNCFKLWIKVCSDRTQLQRWIVIFPMLSAFQEGIGDTPLGIDSTTLLAKMNKGMSTEEFSEQLAPPSPELAEKIQAEDLAIREWMRQAVDGRV